MNKQDNPEAATEVKKKPSKNTNRSNVRKRPARPIESYHHSNRNHIYVNNKSHIKAHIKQVENLINSGFSEVYLHGLGKAIPKIANLALQLVNNSNGVLNYEANTSTVELTDEHHPLTNDDDVVQVRRLNSCLHIKISTNIDINIK